MRPARFGWRSDLYAAPADGYGKYYATGFTLNQGSQPPAVCWIVWKKVNGSWKAMSYVVLTP